MNCLGIDFGLKRIGIAVSVSSIISPLCTIKNTKNVFTEIKEIISKYHITHIYIGIPQGKMAKRIKKFSIDLQSSTCDIPISYVDESISSIEAEKIYIQNKNPKKAIKQKIDAISAGIILNRVLS